MITTKNKLLELNNVLNQFKTTGNAKFKYAFEKNIRLVKPEIDKVNIEVDEINNIIAEFSEKKNDIIKKYGTQKGELISIDKDDENYVVATKELTDLSDEYKEQLELYTSEISVYQKSLNDEINIDINFHELLVDNIPDDFNHDSILMDFEILN